MEEWGPQLRAFVWTLHASHGLTRREGQILFYLCCGMTENKQLARLLCFQKNTLANHLYLLYRKLGVRCRTGAVLATWRVFDAVTRTPAAA